jgi:hypothetical protein
MKRKSASDSLANQSDTPCCSWTHDAETKRCAMLSDKGSDVTTVVIEIEPGWLYIKAADPKPAPEQIEDFLRRTIDQWFEAHPNFIIDRAEAVTSHGVMQGIHV